ncbi:Uncharacterized protein APZ42_005706, partial [Daphnia magna]
FRDSYYPPHWFALLRIHPEVFFSQLESRNALELQIGPTLQKFCSCFKGVQSQAIVAIVRHVSHKDVYLER